jgi:thiamine pyrophosphate-dependent acetolactate synthase large subunit-like protein
MLAAEGSNHPILAEVRARAQDFITQQAQPLRLSVVSAATLADAENRIIARSGSFRLGLCIFESRTIVASLHEPGSLDGVINKFYEHLATARVPTFRTPESVIALIPERDYRERPYQGTVAYRVRVLPDESALLEADLTAMIVSYLQTGYFNRTAQRKVESGSNDVVLGDLMIDLMTDRFGSEWILSYLTGSIVSSLINTLQRRALDANVRVLRGPNEHALACGSFINWRLYRRAYLMVVTSAMIDELKGTLANLQQSNAPGIVVCADALSTKWFGFQATIGSEADVRGVLAARRIPFVYVEKIEDIGPGLKSLCEALDRGTGPVVLIATQQVLEARSGPRSAHRVPRRRRQRRSLIGKDTEAKVERVAEMLSTERAHVLWQCGALSPEELELALAIAEKAAIGLSDALSAPGFVPTYYRGTRVPFYLGPLGQYGTSQSVFDFLQTGATLNDREAQYLFVLKGKLGQIDSPYSEADHSRRMRIVHVNRRPEHLAPFATMRIAMPVLNFLQKVQARLRVEDDVLCFRKLKLKQVRRQRTDVVSLIPTLPMYPNYFFRLLAELVGSLIVEHDYRYEGMFDVGHAGTLAVRWLPRTGPCYSGWYGRGLMGDALMSAAALVTTGRHNVLAIVGDGAKQMVPDVLPSILENLKANGEAIDKNVSIFFIVNNALSIINSYQERMMIQQGGRQMIVVNEEAFVEPDIQTTYGGVELVRRRLTDFDRGLLGNALLRPNRINLFSVPLSVNNDGISQMDSDSWQFAPP